MRLVLARPLCFVHQKLLAIIIMNAETFKSQQASAPHTYFSVCASPLSLHQRLHVLRECTCTNNNIGQHMVIDKCRLLLALSLCRRNEK